RLFLLCDSVLVVFLTDVFEQLIAGQPRQPCLELRGPRLGVRARIIHGHFESEVAFIDARPALDDVQLLRVRIAPVVEPRLVVEADRVDDERVTLPSADRVAPPRRIALIRMLPSVHAELPERVDVPFLPDGDAPRL